MYIVMTSPNFLSCTIAGVFVTHLDQVKPGTSWKLSKYWGFYLVATLDTNDVGIQDLQDALGLVTHYQEWVPNLKQIPAEKCATQDKINNQIASRAFQRVLAVWIVVFQLFLQVVIQVDGYLQEKHKHIWLFFQLFNPDPQGGGLHPFIQIINKLHNASNDALDSALVNHLSDIIGKYFPHSWLILGLDKAQWAARLHPYSGISSSNPRAF
ncbi:hypothetical protein APHAL10511_002966 [Amanita phalloides]|nr:hypothetical protein APHAL10511_002966 [Amanita phalloides]